MIVPTRLNYIKEAVDFLRRQFELMISWVPKCKLVLGEGLDPQKEIDRITSLLTDDKNKTSGIYDMVKDFNSNELLEKLSTEEQIAMLCEVDDTLRKAKQDVEELVNKHYTANFDPYLREISKAIRDVYYEFTFLVPNIRYEIELLEQHFRDPSNSERSITTELHESISHLEKRRISFNEFLNGFTMGNKEFRGYKALRNVDSVFSPFQSYENMPASYDLINGCVYNICKRLEPFLKEHKSEEDFAPFAEEFAEINAKTVARKSDTTGTGKNISSMHDVFYIHDTFNKILQKMAATYSFKEEYQKSIEEFRSFEEHAEALISYDIDAVKNAKENLLQATKDENQKNKIETLMEKANEVMDKKKLPFKRLEWVFQQMMKKNFNLVIMERAKEDVTIAVTPDTTEKYGKNNLKEINLIIEEINFWLHGSEKQEVYDNILTEIEKVNSGKNPDVDSLMKVIKKISGDIETRFRQLYPSVISELGSVMVSLKNVLTSTGERKKINNRLGENEEWQGYTDRLFEARKNILVANGLLKNSSMSKINLFPFMMQSGKSLSLILYEISMRLFSLYDKVDNKSINNMLKILVIFREHNDVRGLWQTFSIFFEKKVVKDFAVMEDRIKILTKNEIAKSEILKKFPMKDHAEKIKHANKKTMA